MEATCANLVLNSHYPQSIRPKKFIFSFRTKIQLQMLVNLSQNDAAVSIQALHYPDDVFSVSNLKLAKNMVYLVIGTIHVPSILRHLVLAGMRVEKEYNAQEKHDYMIFRIKQTL